MAVALAQHPVVNPERRQSMCSSSASAKQAFVCTGTTLGTTCAFENFPAFFSGLFESKVKIKKSNNQLKCLYTDTHIEMYTYAQM